MKISRIICFLLAGFFLTATTSFKRVDIFLQKAVETKLVLEDMTTDETEAIPPELLKNCYAIAVFPNVNKTGFLFGGHHGEGLVFVKDKNNTWSPPAYFSIAGGSYGPDFGKKLLDVVLVVMNARTLGVLIEEKYFNIGDFSVVSGPSTAEESEIPADADIVSYVRAIGLFAGISVQGARLAFIKSRNRKIYKKNFTPRGILIRRQVKVPEETKEITAMLEKYIQ